MRRKPRVPSPDSRRVIAAGADQMVRVWCLAGDSPAYPPSGQADNLPPLHVEVLCGESGPRR